MNAFIKFLQEPEQEINIHVILFRRTIQGFKTLFMELLRRRKCIHIKINPVFCDPLSLSVCLCCKNILLSNNNVI